MATPKVPQKKNRVLTPEILDALPKGAKTTGRTGLAVKRTSRKSTAATSHRDYDSSDNSGHDSHDSENDLPEDDMTNDNDRSELDDPAEIIDPAEADSTELSLTSDLPAVSVSDPLRRFIDEARKFPLLTPEEEVQLAKRLHELGDIDAAKRMVAANLRLVIKIAFEYRNYYSNVMDLIQEGNIGLMKAVSKYDPSKGARLGYYSSWWIRSYILKYILDNFRLVKVGTTAAQKKLFYHLMREKERLEAQGIVAAPKLLAERFDVREKDVIEMQQRLSGSGNDVSLDQPVGSKNSEGDSRATHVDTLRDDHESAEDSLERDELLEILACHLPAFQKQLSEKETRLLEDRILADEPKTLQEIADLYGLTRERARQIEAKLMSKLKDFLKPHLGLD